MTLLKDLNGLHLCLKSLLFGLLAIMPFWYLSIFLLHRDFFNSTSFYVTIVISYCLAVIIFSLSIIIIDSTKEASKAYKDIETDFHARIAWIFIMATFTSIFVLSTTIYIGFIHKWDFYLFLEWTFIPLGVYYILTRINKKLKAKKLPLSN